MPHQCTQCGHTFPDGSKEMLSGCPDCGGNKFQFQPAADAREARSADQSAESRSASASQTPSEPPPNDAQAVEDSAQADARRDVASTEELAGDPTASDAAGDTAAGTDAPPADAPSAGTPPTDESDSPKTDETANMAALRRELDDQFESIKILEPGQYELNLMELYNREEYIIALQEDGQYVIEVPETWLGTDDE